MKSLQETYAPETRCFGCGPANEKGLRIASFPQDGGLVARWRAEPHHQAFPGVLNGGIIGALLDCHSNWCACYSLMKRDGLDRPPYTVTAEFAVKLLRPTPTDGEIELWAKPAKLEGPKAFIEAELRAGGKGQERRVCARCTGLFVAVDPGHPAYRRWD